MQQCLNIGFGFLQNHAQTFAGAFAPSSSGYVPTSLAEHPSGTTISGAMRQVQGTPENCGNQHGATSWWPRMRCFLHLGTKAQR